MSKILNPRQALQRLTSRLDSVRWTQADNVATGLRQDRQLRLNYFTTGTTVAIAVGKVTNRFPQNSLLLAATPEASDDALYCEKGLLWLLRRYPVELSDVELDLLFKQQWTLVTLLTTREQAAPPPLPAVGKYA